MPSRIEELFDRFAADLTVMRPELQDTVLCPFCTRAFGRSALARRDDDGLTLEHIIPGALGGRWKTLTCKRCNNRHGSALDAHLVRMIDAHNWADGDGSSLEGEVAIGGIKVPMRLAWGAAESPNTMAIPGAKPKTLADFQALARSLQDGDKIHMNVSFDFIPSRAQRALVRIGYLTLFESYGYQYVLSGAGKRVRRVIDGDDADQLWQFTPELRNIEETKITNPIIITPVGSVAHLIIVRISAAKRTCHYAVVMPASSVPEGSVPSVISEIVTRLQGNQLAIQVNA